MPAAPKRPRGRPPKPGKARGRDGRNLNVWLLPDEEARLDALMRVLGLSAPDVVRELLRRATNR